MNLAELIKTARDRKGMTQDELAKALGVTRNTVSQWESGETAPKRMRQMLVAKVLGIPLHAISPLQVSGVTVLDDDQQAVNLPVFELSGISMGQTGELTMSVSIGQIVAGNDLNPKCFAARVSDDAMAPEFAMGDVVIIDPTADAHDGDVVMITSPKKATMLRRIVSRGPNSKGQEVFDLHTNNPDYPNLPMNTAITMRLKISGVVVEHRRRMASRR